MMIMIATIREGKNNIGGIRLLNTKNKKVIDTTYECVLSVLENKRYNIENLRVKDKKLVGYNGAIDRYSMIDSGMQLLGESPAVIIAKADNGRYVCSDYRGKILKIDEKTLVEYGKQHGIANGKIVRDRVSAIEGKYQELESNLIAKVKEKKHKDEINKKIEWYRAKCKLLGVQYLEIEMQDEHTVVTKCTGEPISVHIPDFVTAIGADAFREKDTLEDVKMPSSLTAIKDRAFADCRLRQIKLPNSLREIGDGAFKLNDKITEILIPDSVDTLGVSTLAGCTGLQAVKLPSMITKIPAETFNECEDLHSVEIPNTVIEIGSSAFSYCYGLTDINMPENLEVIRKYAFNWSGLSEICIPDSVKIIEKYAFQDCNFMKKVVVGEGVVSIGEGAFFGCDSAYFIAANNRIAKLIEDCGVPKHKIKIGE